MIERPKVYALIPAAGSGTRLGSSIKKQFMVLNNKPILIHTLTRFEISADVDEVLVAVPEAHIAEMEHLIHHYKLHKVSKVIAGGAQRQDSVENLLNRLVIRQEDIILVHDGVRPFITMESISRIVKATKEYGAAALAVQPKDTVRRSVGGDVFDQTLDRTALWLIQTPQGVQAPLLAQAFAQAKKDNFYGTDEIALIERIGIKAKIIQGSYDNIKITTSEDLELASLIIRRWYADNRL